MEKGITVTVQKDNELVFKAIFPTDKADISSVMGYVAEGIGKALKEKSEGYY